MGASKAGLTPRSNRKLLGAAAEEADDNAGGGPIVVLVKIGAERSPVVVDVEQTDVDVPGGVEATPRCLSLAWT